MPETSARQGAARFRRHPVGRWLPRFVVFFVLYWSLAPFALFWFSYVWHWIESVAFGMVAASIEWKPLSGRVRNRG